jgi:hypothetical protein
VVCEEGVRGCDVLFAVSFVCAVERRRGLVLGMERPWPSDACCLCLRELFVCCGGDVCRADDVFFLVQLGDGTAIVRDCLVMLVVVFEGTVCLLRGRCMSD